MLYQQIRKNKIYREIFIRILSFIIIKIFNREKIYNIPNREKINKQSWPFFSLRDLSEPMEKQEEKKQFEDGPPVNPLVFKEVT